MKKNRILHFVFLWIFGDENSINEARNLNRLVS